MDEGWQGQFLQHWVKRHSYSGVFDETHLRFQDDSQPIWFAIRSLHERIHSGDSEFDIPKDHIHLPPLAEQIKRDLEELL
jgi:hypothetical protein